MVRKNKTKIWAYLITVFAVILVSTATWAFYNFLNAGVEVILFNWGIVNPFAQSAIIFGVVFVILVLFGTGIFKSIDKIIGR